MLWMLVLLLLLLLRLLMLRMMVEAPVGTAVDVVVPAETHQRHERNGRSQDPISSTWGTAQQAACSLVAVASRNIVTYVI